MGTVSKPQDSEAFDDVAVQVTEKEWASLKPTRKALYEEAMVENYRTVASLAAASQDRPALNVDMEQEKEALIRMGWEPSLAGELSRVAFSCVCSACLCSIKRKDIFSAQHHREHMGTFTCTVSDWPAGRNTRLQVCHTLECFCPSGMGNTLGFQVLVMCDHLLVIFLAFTKSLNVMQYYLVY